MIRRALGASILTLLLVSGGKAEQDIPDLGAGPIRIGITSCLVFKQRHQGPPCTEPEVLTTGDNAMRVANRLARAHYFIDVQDLDKAREETDLALAIEAQNLPARLLSARLALTMADTARAESDLALARKQAPDNADVNATHAFFLQTKPADIESLREFDDVIRKHPDHIYSHQERALLLIRFGRPADALSDLNFLVEKWPNTISFSQRARAFVALGRPDSAAADLSAAIKLDPDRHDLLVERAQTYAAADLSELALKDYNTLLSTVGGGVPLYPMMDNDRAKLLAQRAYLLVHVRRFDEAVGDILDAVKVGGKPAILRAQILLRRNGFPDVALDGQESESMKKALAACFGLNACFQGIMQSI